MATTVPEHCAEILRYLREAHVTNPQAEVPAVALERELGIDRGLVRQCLERLIGEGLVDGDLLPANLWVRLSDLGAVDPPVSATTGQGGRP